MRAHVAGEGPPVVLLHGQPGSHLDWRRVTKRLAGTHRVFAVDRSGYGDAALERPGGFADNADDLVRLLDEYGIERATVVGHSWGGGAALFGPLLAFGAFRHVAPRFPRLWQCLSGSRLSPAHSAEVATEVRSWGRVRLWRTFLAEQRAMLREIPEVERHLGDMHVPTTVVVGDRDRVVSRSVGEHLARAIPGARVRVVLGAGHLLPVERPDALADVIRDASLA